MGEVSEVLEQLQQKYESVLHLMYQLQVRVLNIHLEGGKLLIRGVAPSVAAKNRVWERIKDIDPRYADLICDLSVSAQQQRGAATRGNAAMSAGASAEGGQDQRHYTVKPGDTLTKISRDFYGDADQYTKIVNANRNLLSGPNAIHPGQELVIPE